MFAFHARGPRCGGFCVHAREPRDGGFASLWCCGVFKRGFVMAICGTHGSNVRCTS